MFNGLAAVIGTGSGAAITTGTTLGAILGTQKIGNHQIEYMAGGQAAAADPKYKTVQTTKNRDLTGWTPSVGTIDEFGETNYGASIKDIRSVAYGKDLWVAAGDDDKNGANNVMWSRDGKFWTFSTGTYFYGTVGHTGALSVAYGNGTWLVGGTGNQNKNLYKSTDGKTWSIALQSTTEVGFEYYTISVGYGKGRFVAIGEKETGYKTTIMYSDDNASNWTRSTVPSTFSPYSVASDEGGTDVAYGSNNNWVAVGGGSGDPVNSILFSTSNGKSWMSCYSITRADGGPYTGTATFSCVAYGNGTWVVGGSSDAVPVIYSKDPEGKRWTALTGNPVPGVNQTVIYDGTRFLMNSVGDSIYSSLDGITWEEVVGSSGIDGLSDIHVLAYKP